MKAKRGDIVEGRTKKRWIEARMEEEECVGEG